MYHTARLYFITHTLVLNAQPLFELHTFINTTNIVHHSFILTFTSTIPITPTNTENYFPSDDPKFTNLMISHFDCEKQHNLRQFKLLNVKQCTEAPSNIQHASVEARVYVRAKAKRNKAYKCVAYAKKEKKFVSKAQLNIDVLIELYGTITLCHFLLHLIL